jgi:hypothetical protein
VLSACLVLFKSKPVSGHQVHHDQDQDHQDQVTTLYILYYVFRKKDLLATSASFLRLSVSLIHASHFSGA